MLNIKSSTQGKDGLISMWISQIVNKDPEARETLKELAKLIKKYSDPTDIHKHSFFSTNLGRLFRPRTAVYFCCCSIMVCMTSFLHYIGAFSVSDFYETDKILLTVSTTVLVIGVSFSQIVKSVSESNRLASAYLTVACNMRQFATLTFFTVLCGIISVTVYKNSWGHSQALPLYSAYLFVAATTTLLVGSLWSIASLIYILIENVRCMDLNTSIRCAIGWGVRTLSKALLSDAYHDTQSGLHSKALETFCRDTDNIFGPSSYLYHWVKVDEKTHPCKYTVRLNGNCNEKTQYKDYNTTELKRVGSILKEKNAKFFLAGDSSTSNEVGSLYTQISRKELEDTLQDRLRRMCRHRNTKIAIVEDNLWESIYYELYNAFLRAITSKNVVEFRECTTILHGPYKVLRPCRKHAVVRDFSSLEYKHFRHLDLYTELLESLLKMKDTVSTSVLEAFIRSLEKSVWEHIHDEIRHGSCYTIGALVELIPIAYSMFIKYVTDKTSRLWDLRAFAGSNYTFLKYMFSECEDVNEEESNRIKQVLHKGIIGWLMLALKHDDQDLVKALCKTARQLAFDDCPDIKLESNALMRQHLILCGKVISDLLRKGSLGKAELLNLLVYKETYKSQSYLPEFNTIVEFYIQNRSERELSDYLSRFYNTEWENNPLTRSGSGPISRIFEGITEFDYLFIFLAIWAWRDGLPRIRPIDFSMFDLVRKVEKLGEIADIISLHPYRYVKTDLIQWMKKCTAQYETEEQQKLIDAPLEVDKVQEFTEAFWDGYQKEHSFFRHCIEKKYFSISETARQTGHFRLEKEYFVENDGSTQAVGRSNGKSLVRRLDTQFVKKLQQAKVHDSVGNPMLLFERASRWLIDSGIAKDSAVIVYCGGADIQMRLYKHKSHSHIQDNTLLNVYDGFFNSYPLITIFDQKAEQSTCTAINLTEWKGIKARPELFKGMPGELNVRLWSDAEIETFVNDGKLQEADRNRMKTTCLADYEIFWELDEKSLPEQYSVTLKESLDDEGESSNACDCEREKLSQSDQSPAVQ